MTRNHILHPTATTTTAIKEAFKSRDSDIKDSFSKESVYIAMIGGAVSVVVILILILLVVLINNLR